MRSSRLLLSGLVAVVAVSGSVLWAMQREYKSGVVFPEPKVVTPGEGAAPPSDAIVLFDGKDLSKFHGGDKWSIENGVATVQKSDITTKDSFGTMQLHLEFATPEKVVGGGQGRGNSGVYIMGKYEIQILDSYDNKTYFDGQCASVYKQQPPMVNACRKPGEWQSYDILFEAPQFDEAGKVVKPAYVTVIHNGVVVHHHFELTGGTFYDQPAHYVPHAPKLPFRLQNHGNPVKFRNIWVREMVPLQGKKPEAKTDGEPKKPE